MPNLTAPVPLMLDRERWLRFDNRALFTVERELCRLWGRQVSLLTLFANLDALTLNDVAVLLWQGLRQEDPTLTLEQTQDLMDFDKLPAILAAVLDAWNATTQPAVPLEEVEQQSGPLSFPGVNSGATPALS